MVNRITQDLECIRFENDTKHLEKEIQGIIIKADIFPYKNYFQVHFHVEDLPIVHRASVCLFELRTDVKEVIKIKPIFTKVTSKVIRCSGYPLRPNKSSNSELILKLRAKCLI